MEPQPQKKGIRILALLAAAGVTVAGALGMIGFASVFARLEVLAFVWLVLIGAGAGWASKKLGGQGRKQGLACAAVVAGVNIALLMVGIQLALDKVKERELEAQLEDEQEMFDEFASDAEAFAAMNSEGDYHEFMVEHGYATRRGRGRDKDVTAEEELETFKAYHAPNLKWIHDNKPDFEIWWAHRSKELPAIYEADSTFTVIGFLAIALAKRTLLSLFLLFSFAYAAYFAYRVSTGYTWRRGRWYPPTSDAEAFSAVDDYDDDESDFDDDDDDDDDESDFEEDEQN